MDEIDKGDLDFANDLLDVFDDGSFTAPVTGQKVERRRDHDLLVVITSNGDRDLSAAFRRRCIPIRMEPPAIEEAVGIGRAHMTARAKEKTEKLPKLSDDQLTELAEIEQSGGGINVSGFVDLLDAVVEFPNALSDWDRFKALMRAFSTMRHRNNGAQA